MKRIDLCGQRFGKLVVVSLAGKNKWANLRFNCKCDCGNFKEVQSHNLRRGVTRSCGCISSRHLIGVRSTTHGHTRNGHSDSFYNRFCTIKSRCNNSNSPKYHLYGAKGVRCLWKSFEEFKKDMYESYLEHVEEFGIKNTSIDRRDNDGHYCKENCRWATPLEQANNTSQNVLYEFRGEKHTKREWAEITGIRYDLLKSRLDKGWSIDKALTTMVR